MSYAATASGTTDKLNAFSLRMLRHWATVLVLASSDLLCFALVYYLFRVNQPAPALSLAHGRPLIPDPRTIDVFLILAAFYVPVRYCFGDYSRRQLFWDGAKRTTASLLITSVPDLIFFLLLAGRCPYYVFFCTWSILLVTVPCARQLARILMSAAGLWRIPTAIVGSGDRVNRIHEAISQSLALGYDIRWIIGNVGDTAPRPVDGATFLQATGTEDLIGKINTSDCRHVLVAAEDMQSSQLADSVRRLIETGVGVSIVPSLSRLPLISLSTSYFFGRDVLLLQVRNNLNQMPQRFVKRTTDIVGSTLLLLLLSPFFLIIAIAIKTTDAGPAFYMQKRIGRGGRAFRCVKFRSMAVDADARLQRWRVENPALYEEFLQTYKLREDPRVTKIGSWLRATSLDELPQLANVLVGQMSLVGPRPVLDVELREQYGSAAELYKRVRPGITGLWQVSGRSDTTYAERVVYDELYILNWSFWYDIVILLQTAWTVVLRKGAF